MAKPDWWDYTPSWQPLVSASGTRPWQWGHSHWFLPFLDEETERMCDWTWPMDLRGWIYCVCLYCLRLDVDNVVIFRGIWRRKQKWSLAFPLGLGFTLRVSRLVCNIAQLIDIFILVFILFLKLMHVRLFFSHFHHAEYSTYPHVPLTFPHGSFLT